MRFQKVQKCKYLLLGMCLCSDASGIRRQCKQACFQMRDAVAENRGEVKKPESSQVRVRVMAYILPKDAPPYDPKVPDRHPEARARSQAAAALMEQLQALTVTSACLRETESGVSWCFEDRAQRASNGLFNALAAAARYAEDLKYAWDLALANPRPWPEDTED